MKRDEWLCGYAAALATMGRVYDAPTQVRNVMQGDGITVEKLKLAGVGPYDLRVIRKAMRP